MLCRSRHCSSPKTPASTTAAVLALGLGIGDIVFCDQADTLAIGTPAFEASFRSLTGELVALLQRMRNHSTPVFLYPPNPSAELQDFVSRPSYRHGVTASSRTAR